METFTGALIASGAILFIVLTKLSSSKRAVSHSEGAPYHYAKKLGVMSPREVIFWNALRRTYGGEYLIVPQAHLSILLDEHIKGQNWRAAFRHVNQKSVDFLLCDLVTTAPILAIELDDASHQRRDRVTRDGEVERILAEAGIPLTRIDSVISESEAMAMLGSFLSNGVAPQN